MIDVAVNLRNKEAFEYLVQKCGGNQKLFNYFCEVYRSDRVDDVKWLWKAFPDVLNKLVSLLSLSFFILFYFILLYYIILYFILLYFISFLFFYFIFFIYLP